MAAIFERGVEFLDRAQKGQDMTMKSEGVKEGNTRCKMLWREIGNISCVIRNEIFYIKRLWHLYFVTYSYLRLRGQS